MNQDNKIENAGKITIALIANSYLNKEFPHRVQEKIGREEIKDFKKKFDITALTSVLALIVISLVLMILQFT